MAIREPGKPPQIHPNGKIQPLDVRRKFRKPIARLELVSAYSGSPTPYEGEQAWLAPGQGVLLKLISKGAK